MENAVDFISIYGYCKLSVKKIVVVAGCRFGLKN